MTASFRRPVTWALLALSLTALILAANPHVGAQAPKIDDGEARLGDLDTREMRALRTALLKGEAPALTSNKDHVLAIGLGVKQLIYPMARTDVQRRDGGVNKIFEDFDRDLDSLARYKPRSDGAVQIYCREAIGCCLEVLAKNKAISAVNATRLLARLVEWAPGKPRETWLAEVSPRLAEGNAELLAAALVEQLKSSNDGVRYYALRGLSDVTAFGAGQKVLKPETEEAAVREALPLIDRPRTFLPGTPKEEIEGYKVLRREAVKLLSQGKAPQVGKDRPALALFRVAGADVRVVPPPRVDERVEAAIGLARVRAAAGSPYSEDAAADAIGRAALALSLVATEEFDRKASERTRPWKVLAARLAETLDLMLLEVKNPHAQSVARESLKQLLLIEEGKKKPNPADLQEWLTTNLPATRELFKGDAATALKEAGEKE